MPRPVVPILVRPVFCSRPTSIRLWYGRMTWAFSLTTSCAGSESKPRLLSRSISSSSASGSTTTPFPMKHRLPACSTPLGTRCKTVFTPPTTSVWPAFAPPWYRTTTSAHEVKRSTIFPFPSSPHWAPTITTLDMDLEYHGWRGSEDDLADLEHVRQLAQLLQGVRAGRPVDVDERQRAPRPCLAGERELGDVHLRFAESTPHVADHAGLVLVDHDEHRALRRGLDRELVDAHHAGLALADDGARHLGGSGLRAQPDRHQAGEVRGLVALHLGDGEAPLLGQRRRAHLVDRLGQEGAQDSLEHGGGERRGRLLRHLSGVGDLDLLRRGGGLAFQRKLRAERAHLLAEPEERTQTLEDFPGDAGHVHRVADGAAGQVVHHRLADDGGHVLLRVRGRPAQVRSADEVGAGEERVAFGRRLLLEDVERGAAQLARLQRFGEGLLVA